jgi:hypothetical protein
MGFDAEGLIKLLVYWLIFQTIDAPRNHNK